MTRRPFPLAIPPELTAYILDLEWDLDQLHRLDLLMISVRVSDLAHHLDLPFWRYDGRPFQVTPREVAADPAKYHEQWDRVLAADSRQPLHVVRRANGRLTILDGIHRLLRAELEGLPTIVVHVLPWEDLDEIAVRG
ncbi:hypothetical protein [Kribbella sp. NPDC055071]